MEWPITLVRTISVFSNKKSQEDIIEDICAQIDAVGQTPQLIVFTAEDSIFWYCSYNIKQRYNSATTMGTTSYVNFCDKGYSQKGMSAVVFFSGIECSAGVLFEIQRHPMNYIMHIRNALDSMSSTNNTICLEFCTAFSNGEELVQDTFEKAFTGKDIPVVGSSAGTTINLNLQTFVSLNGEMYKNSCVFCLIHNLEGRIFYYRENIFKPTQYTFVATDVNCEEKTVYEYNDKPAVLELSSRVGVLPDELPEYLETHHMGRILDNEVFITAASTLNEDHSITYYSRIYNRSKLVMLEMDNVEDVWDETALKIKNEVPEPSFSIVINGLGRAKYFEQTDLCEKYLKCLNDNYGEYFGVSGFGEQMKYKHLNQSMLIIVFE